MPLRGSTTTRALAKGWKVHKRVRPGVWTVESGGWEQRRSHSQPAVQREAGGKAAVRRTSRAGPRSTRDTRELARWPAPVFIVIAHSLHVGYCLLSIPSYDWIHDLCNSTCICRNHPHPSWTWKTCRTNTKEVERAAICIVCARPEKLVTAAPVMVMSVASIYRHHYSSKTTL